MENVGSTYLCKSSHWSSTDEQEVSRILCIPKWALCLDSGLCALTHFWRAEWSLHLFPNPFFLVSLTSAPPKRLRSGCWWQRYVGSEELLRTTQQGRGGGGTEPSRQGPAEQTCPADSWELSISHQMSVISTVTTLRHIWGWCFSIHFLKLYFYCLIEKSFKNWSMIDLQYYISFKYIV